MNASRHASRALVGLVVACVVATTPSFAFADSDRHHKKHKRHSSHDRDHREWRDRDDDDDRRRSRSRHKRGHHGRHVVEYTRPVFSVGVNYGAPVCRRPVYVAPACPAPVVYVPQPVYAPVSYGPYYDPGCDRRFSSFELYVAHVGDRHAASVRISN
jgi:hypothetical protein